MQFMPVPGHPYASYRSYTDGYGRMIIECRCSHPSCNAFWQKHCLRPELKDKRIFDFAAIHGHGHGPRLRR
jgi:hypothetical protein